MVQTRSNERDLPAGDDTVLVQCVLYAARNKNVSLRKILQMKEYAAAGNYDKVNRYVFSVL